MAVVVLVWGEGGGGKDIHTMLAFHDMISMFTTHFQCFLNKKTFFFLTFITYRLLLQMRPLNMPLMW